MPDAIFAGPRRAEIYDPLDPDRSDLDAYAAMAAEFGTRSVMDVGGGTGTLACWLAGRGGPPAMAGWGGFGIWPGARARAERQAWWQDGGMARSHEILGLLDRFDAALNAHDLDAAMALLTDDAVFESTFPAPDGTRYEGRDAVRKVLAGMLEATPGARFSTEEQFCDGVGRAVVRWRYDWAGGHVRGVDIHRVRDGKIAETLSYVKG